MSEAAVPAASAARAARTPLPPGLARDCEDGTSRGTSRGTVTPTGPRAHKRIISGFFAHDVHRQFKIAAARRGISMQRLLEIAVEQVLRADAAANGDSGVRTESELSSN